MIISVNKRLTLLIAQQFQPACCAVEFKNAKYGVVKCQPFFSKIARFDRAKMNKLNQASNRISFTVVAIEIIL